MTSDQDRSGGWTRSGRVGLRGALFCFEFIAGSETFAAGNWKKSKGVPDSAPGRPAMVSGVRFGAHIRSSPSGGTPRARAIPSLEHMQQVWESAPRGLRAWGYLVPGGQIMRIQPRGCLVVGWSACRRCPVEAARARHFLGLHHAMDGAAKGGSS